MRQQHLVYIHGFNSSPASVKARLLAEYIEQQPHFDPPLVFHVPQLAYDPHQAIETLCQLIVRCSPEPVHLIGSSLGGYYGTWIAETYGLPLVLVNPAVKPYELLADYLGENENIYTGEKYSFEPWHIKVLQQLDKSPSNPGRYFLLVQTADEVLDYRQAVTKFSSCQQQVIPGGSHGFDEFELHIPAIFKFFGF